MPPRRSGSSGGLGYDLDIDGDVAVRRKLVTIGDRARDPRPALKVVAALLQRGQAKQFASQGSYLGETWAPNAPATTERKENIGDNTPLVNTGALKAAAEGRGRGKLLRVTRTQARVGVNVFHAVFHQGSTGHEPRRIIVGIHRRDRARAVRIVQEFLVRRL